MGADIAEAYRAYIANECIAAGAQLSDIPSTMPFNQLVQKLITLTAQRVDRAAQCCSWEAAVERTKAQERLRGHHKKGLAAIAGKWPGDETDEEINAALEKLS